MSIRLTVTPAVIGTGRNERSFAAQPGGGVNDQLAYR